jgi:F0F1-type ATP synthase assembly protein I
MEQDEKSNMQEFAEEDLKGVSGGFQIPTVVKVGLGAGLVTGIVVGGVVGYMDRSAGTRNAALPALGAGGVSGVAAGGVGVAIVAGAKKMAGARV